MSEKKNISKKELRRRKRKRALMIKTGILCVLLVIFGIGIWALAGGTEKIQQKAQEKEDQKTAEVDGSVSSEVLKRRQRKHRLWRKPMHLRRHTITMEPLKSSRA